MNRIKRFRRLKQISLTLIILLSLAVQIPLFAQSAEKDMSFIVANDWRYKTTGQFAGPEFFRGALLKIKEVGKGSFMLSPGDVSPMGDSRELIADVLGQDYLWYPSVGNHEMPEDGPYLEYFREWNKGGTSLPNIVRKGPPGSEETTYSFEIGDCHIAVINEYYDGKSDHGMDGNVVPELLEWLEEDLKNTDKPYIFVAGHEPMVALPDLDNGRIRHQGDSMDKYPENNFKFYQLLKKYNVNAYFHGHTHCTSIGKINGVWQVTAGHTYGLERQTPTYLFKDAQEYLNKHKTSGLSEEDLLEKYFYEVRTYNIKKALYSTDMTGGVDYHDLKDEPALKHFINFYKNYNNDKELREKYIKTFDELSDQTRSTFLKVYLKDDQIKVDVYRDDARGGKYNLMHTYFLD
ncbi:MAG TPA: metallophosphoesterase [bacterium]|nr:metallophosphoesterase [bacterium]